jgi:hypothetical protein
MRLTSPSPGSSTEPTKQLNVQRKDSKAASEKKRYTRMVQLNMILFRPLENQQI